MKKLVKSYLVFTSSLYRIVMYVLMPAALVGISLGLGRYLGEVVLMWVALLLIMIEVVSDSWLFGGIQARDPERIDYLKTSGQGMRVMRNALFMDLFRKLLSGLGILAVCYLAIRFCGWISVQEMFDYSNSGAAEAGTGILLYFVLVSYFFSVTGTFLSRYGNTVWSSMIVGYMAMTPALFCMLLPGVTEYVLFYNLLFAVLDAGISIAAVKLAMKRIKGGYYDK